MIKHLEHTLGTIDGQRMIQRRRQVFQQHRNGIDERRRQKHAAAIANRMHDRDGDGRNGQGRAHAMGNGIADFFAHGIFAHLPVATHGVASG